MALLDSFEKDRNSQKLLKIMFEGKDAVSGVLLPSKQDMSDSESETIDVAQGRKGLKILTPKQMITRLTILLAELKAVNTSQKLKNEITQIDYSLYRSKNLSNTVYNNLINTI